MSMLQETKKICKKKNFQIDNRFERRYKIYISSQVASFIVESEEFTNKLLDKRKTKFNESLKSIWCYLTE